MERDCVWQKKQKWRVDDQEAGLQEDRALQEEVTLDQESDHRLEMQEKHLRHRIGPDLPSAEILDPQEDRLIQDPQEDLQLQDRQEELIQDHREELIQDPQKDQATLDHQDDQKARMLVPKKDCE